MSGDHAKKMVIGSEESANNNKDGSPSRVRSHKSGEKKKKMKKVVYYETDSSSPSTSGPCSSLLSAKSARSIVRSPYAILTLISILHCFPSH
jgi:hypothetical protein